MSEQTHLFPSLQSPEFDENADDYSNILREARFHREKETAAPAVTSFSDLVSSYPFSNWTKFMWV